MSDMKKINEEMLNDVTGGVTKIVNTNTSQNAAVRSGPGKSFEIIESLPNGTRVNFTGKQEYSREDGRHFAQIDSPVYGWIASSIIGLDR